jgi:hypothetical protein
MRQLLKIRNAASLTHQRLHNKQGNKMQEKLIEVKIPIHLLPAWEGRGQPWIIKHLEDEAAQDKNRQLLAFAGGKNGKFD